MTTINPPLRRWLTAFAISCWTLAVSILATGLIQ